MEFEIVCVVKNPQGVITWVGLNDGTRHKVGQMIEMMRQNTFFTIKNGYKALVYPRQHPSTGSWFLTTDPDSIVENNLDFLDYCPPIS